MVSREKAAGEWQVIRAQPARNRRATSAQAARKRAASGG
jgi:hypothetical protein